MFDPKISAGFTGAALLWFTGFALILIDLFALRADDLGHLGIGLCCGGAVLMIRSMMCRATNQLENLFDVGRDFGRAESERLSLQRVR